VTVLRRALIVVTPTSKLTPSALAEQLSWLGLPLTIKLYGFGLVVEGDEEHVDAAVKYAWSLDPDNLLVKPRGFPSVDERFTSQYTARGVARRKGLVQLDFELEMALNMARARGRGVGELKPKIVECKHVREYVVALVVEVNGEKYVYCPEKRFMGDHACYGRCPYGRVILWA